MHNKTFNSIGKKVHAAALAVASQNFEKARLLTKEEVGGADVAVMFDDTWQKRGHKSHNGVGPAMSVDIGLCFDFEVLSNYCLTCSGHQDLGKDEETWQAFHVVLTVKRMSSAPPCHGDRGSSPHMAEDPILQDTTTLHHVFQ
ncbi:hypothetical protein HPB47_011129 [Ixodes persulcatus]|uniref:Uncharacterized protein n=1 Tax=Ixodes persulcatus TaxID=34615 RepID=A0AC60NXD0_IXOPE|nr:hypothetical protein HPB47_011129 [Ixodes persulcatus]